MKNTLILLITLAFSLAARGSETLIKDMCPQLPEEISSKEPQYSDFVTVESGAELLAQYEEYRQAIEKFESLYSEEIKLVASKWEKLKENQFPSQNRFYHLQASGENGKLLSEVKAVCWSEVMGNDEMVKDDLCNPLEKPPISKEWTQILLCTVESVKLLNIKLLSLTVES